MRPAWYLALLPACVSAQTLAPHYGAQLPGLPPPVVSVSWQPVAGATYYVAYIFDGNGWVDFAEVDSGTAVQFTDVTRGQPYSVDVFGYDDSRVCVGLAATQQVVP